MATQWVVIAASDLEDYQAGPVMKAIREKALAAGQSDPFPEIREDVSRQIRAKIANRPENILSATQNAIPPEIKWIGCVLIIETMQTRVPTLELTEQQKTMISRAVKQLDRIADGLDKVTEPTDPEAEPEMQQGTPIKVVSYTPRTVTARTMAGI